MSQSSSTAGAPVYAEAWTGGKNPWAIAWAVTLATFMETLDISVANVALPHIAGALSATQDQSTWVLTTYLLANAVVLPISGFLAARLGRKRYYMASVFVFTLSSLLCGCAPSLGLLVMSRLVQGLAGGGLAPCEQAILVDTFPAAQRGMAMAVYGMAIVLAPAIGPTVGGYITDHLSWRWIFLINVPIGVLSLTLTQHLLSDPPHLVTRRVDKGGIDYIGLALIAVGLGCLQLVLSRGQEQEWLHSALIRWTSVMSALCLVSFVAWELRQAQPILDLRILRARNLGIANLMMLFGTAVLYGSTVLLPQFAQTLLHYSAEQAGYLLSPGALLMVVLMPCVGALVTRVDVRLLIALGFILVGGAVLDMTRHVCGAVDMLTLIKLRCCQTVGMSLMFVPLNTIAYDGIPAGKRGSVSSLMNLSRNVGGELGIAVVITALARRSQTHQAQLVEHVTGNSPELSRMLGALSSALERGGAAAHSATRQAYALVYREVVTQATILAYADALRFLACAAVVMLPLLSLLPRPRGSKVSGGH